MLDVAKILTIVTAIHSTALFDSSRATRRDRIAPSRSHGALFQWLGTLAQDIELAGTSFIRCASPDRSVQLF
ncbi:MULTISPECIES: hypothetical protein [unclassified Bradyrhizobium]|uniref:hypothetical protein n=1 Tax=unclassified Bradyrhizobium TaxID=2631580 RepID=UPI0018DCBD69|nr:MULTISPECIES: hypothetical protein [unclassified Bradyrhizobium]MCP3464560.1 hypothetical protein [Bradyrhizobium sp. CCGUVB23]